jgi:hypothetical protein
VHPDHTETFLKFRNRFLRYHAYFLFDGNRQGLENSIKQLTSFFWKPYTIRDTLRDFMTNLSKWVNELHHGTPSESSIKKLQKASNCLVEGLRDLNIATPFFDDTFLTESPVTQLEQLRSLIARATMPPPALERVMCSFDQLKQYMGLMEFCASIPALTDLEVHCRGEYANIAAYEHALDIVNDSLKQIWTKLKRGDKLSIQEHHYISFTHQQETFERAIVRFEERNEAVKRMLQKDIARTSSLISDDFFSALASPLEEKTDPSLLVIMVNTALRRQSDQAAMEARTVAATASILEDDKQEQQLKRLRARIADLDAQLKALKRQKAEKETTAASIAAANHATTVAKAENTALRSELQRSHRDARAEIERLQAYLQELKKEKDDAVTKAQTMQRTADDAVAKAQTMQRTADDAVAKAQNVQHTLQEMQRAANDAATKAQEMQRIADDQQQQAFTTLQDRVQQAEALIERQRSSLAGQNRKITEKNRIIQNLEGVLDRLRHELIDTARNAEVRQKALEDEIQTLREALAQMQIMEQKYAEERNSLRAALKYYEKNIARLRQERDEAIERMYHSRVAAFSPQSPWSHSPESTSWSSHSPYMSPHATAAAVASETGATMENFDPFKSPTREPRTPVSPENGYTSSRHLFDADATN